MKNNELISRLNISACSYLFYWYHVEEHQRMMSIQKQIFHSFNPVHSLGNPPRISQDPKSQGFCQVLFRILFRILVISVSRIFKLKQDSVQDFFKFLLRHFSKLRIQDPISIYLRFNQDSSENYERGFCQDFIRFSSESRSNLRVRIDSHIRRGSWLENKTVSQNTKLTNPAQVCTSSS